MWSQTVLTSCGPESKELGEEDWRLEDKVLTSAPDGGEGVQADRALQGWGRRVAELGRAPDLRGREGDRDGGGGDGGGVRQVDGQLQPVGLVGRGDLGPGLGRTAGCLAALLLLGEQDVLLGGVLDLDEVHIGGDLVLYGLLVLVLRVGGTVSLTDGQPEPQGSVDGVVVSGQVLL